MLRRQSNTRVVLDEVIGIDTAARLLRTRDNAAQHYDYLLLCTGSEYSFFGHDDWARFAPSLKSVEDATKIRRRVLLAFERAAAEADPAARDRLPTFALVGGGPTGVEMAGAVAELARAQLARALPPLTPASARTMQIGTTTFRERAGPQ